MKAREALRRSGIAVQADDSVRAAAQVLEASGVGALVVVDGTTPLGVVTDRDLVRRSLAAGAAPDARIDSVMSTPVVTIDADADLHDAFALFRTHGVRRLVVVTGGELVGVLSVDDLLIDLAADLSDLARPITAETLFGQHDVGVPALT